MLTNLIPLSTVDACGTGFTDILGENPEQLMLIVLPSMSRNGLFMVSVEPAS